MSVWHHRLCVHELRVMGESSIKLKRHGKCFRCCLSSTDGLSRPPSFSWDPPLRSRFAADHLFHFTLSPLWLLLIRLCLYLLRAVRGMKKHRMSRRPLRRDKTSWNQAAGLLLFYNRRRCLCSPDPGQVLETKRRTMTDDRLAPW